MTTGDGSRFELLCVTPTGTGQRVLYWLPAMGVPARHYLPWAEALTSCGIAVVVHEWRGIGSSSRRASRQCNWGYREMLENDLPPARAAIRERWPDAACFVGGHSLGGQLAMLYAALTPEAFSGLVLVASGAPYWRQFARGWMIAAAYIAAPGLAWSWGYLPGRRIGFGGNEARGVIADWSRTGRTGLYAAHGLALDLEQALQKMSIPVLGLRLADDWLAPLASLTYLLDKAPLAPRMLESLSARDLDVAATHFGWMQAPHPLAARVVAWMDRLPTPG